MKIPTLILTIILLTSCIHSKKTTQKKLIIESDLINEIFIKKELYGTDSILLNKHQTKIFIEEWNNAKSEGLYKMEPEFWIILKLKNDSIRKFRTNRNLIKEDNDWAYSISDSTLIRSFWKNDYAFARPENYDPISFINRVSLLKKIEKDTLLIAMTMVNEFPKDWVKEEHIENLIKLLGSKEKCGCFLNPLSSYVPTNDDYAEKGGYAGIFIKAFKENKNVNLGLYSCPKVDEKLNVELINWWKERK